ncbi:hypothetical protein UFOVP1655_96 [uncultured Caudovirales phage]|uniref:Uncharacterized protein n=1 Tax=uncultured Caudovirales phage TaxID=2100421 RepID=A0A6J5T486_9CAUD|nr:hypothetical protein UFOVP1655_96 [uncultured Caudovirales phage]
MNYKMFPPTPRELYSKLKNSAKKRSIEFDLTIHDLYMIDLPISCPVLGIPLRWNIGEAKDDSYSFDRIDSSKGYTFDNLEVISFKANRCKNNLTEEEMKKFCLYYS